MPPSSIGYQAPEVLERISLVQLNTETSATIKEVAVPEEIKQHRPVELQHIKLISVSLKEAALDSPSFRASVKHLHEQILTSERWILALRSSLSKIPRQVNELQSYIDSFLEYLMPHSLQDGLVDQEYTQAAMNTAFEGLKSIWDISLGLIEFSIPRLESIKNSITERIALYKTYKVRFDEAQANYDRFLLIHMSMSKLKEAVLVMEDLQLLFSVRKEYLSASLDLIVELNEVIEYINHRITRFVYQMWNQRMERFGSHPIVSQLLLDVWIQLRRVSSWYDHYGGSVRRLRSDIKVAKRQIYDSTCASFLPSSNEKDYSVSLINTNSLECFPESAVEKHGHLFMKTYVDKSTKPIWVQRWAFLQGGVFGLLVLSPSGDAVQETDKIGALLCNTKYTPNEDRRFCFELKTTDTTVVFQAETLRDLSLWLKVFENVRARITTPGDPMSHLFNIAGIRCPPLMTEFACTVNTTTDKLLTNTKIINREGQMIASSKLSNHLVKNQKLFQNFVYKLATKIKLPFFTAYSRLALIAYSLAGSTAVPTALTANIWGSLNWGCYYLHEDLHHDIRDRTMPEDTFTKQIGHGIMVPSNFPDTLLGGEIQMRALFESEADSTECCLLSFQCLWSPNSVQELRGTTFVTQKNMYFYLHSLGFVALTKTPMEQVIEATCVLKDNYDYVKIYRVNGLVKTKIFLGEGILIARKINGIIENIASDEPLDVVGLINKLRDIERDYELKKEELVNLTQHKGSPEEANSFEYDTKTDTHNPRFKIDFLGDMSFVGQFSIKLPPKAVIHALIGRRSEMIDSSYPIVSIKYVTSGLWAKKPGSDRGLYRDMLAALVFSNGDSETINIRHELEDLCDNEYYCLKFLKTSFRFATAQFEVCTRTIIIATEGGNSKVLTYVGLNFYNKSIFNPFLRGLAKTFQAATTNGVRRRLEKAAKAMGSHGQIAKAIYIYGKIPMTKEPHETPEMPPVRLRVDTMIKVLARGTIGSIIRRTKAFIYFVVNLVQTFLKSLSMHRFLVFVIICLCMMNTFLVGRSTVTYWQSKNAKELMLDIIQGEPMIMERAIYLKDVQELIENQYVTGSNSTCFRIFQNQSFVQNYNQALAWRMRYEDDLSRTAASSLRQALREIGIRRNELIVSLQMLRQLEEDVAKGEWRNWLLDELEKCSGLINPHIDGELLDLVETNYSEGVDNLVAFCECCSHEMAHLDIL